MASNKSCSCTPVKKKRMGRSAFPLLTGILIAIIPKCPFCLLAYSSAITMCSGRTIYNHSPEWTSWISIGLALVTLLLVLLNYKGKKTIWAAGLVLVGSCILIRTELMTGSPSEYTIGTVILLIGVWLNASFMYFYRKWIQPLLSFLYPKRERIN